MFLLLAGWCVVAPVVLRADPAVLIKAYSAEVIRGHYLLGKRVVRMGEMVRVQSVDGPRATVKTMDGDKLVVYVTDLRPLSEEAVAQTAAAQPTPSPTPTAPLVKPVEGVASSVLALLGASPPPPAVAEPTVAIKQKPVGAPRREVSVQCGGTTKKGTPCTRMTKSPNGLCWQHGGD